MIMILTRKLLYLARIFSQAVVDAMKTEPFASMANKIGGIEVVFFSFSARVGRILFEERTRVEK